MRLGVAHPRLQHLDAVQNMAVGYVQVGVPIVVVIKKRGAKAQIEPARPAQARRRGHILEVCSLVAIERIGLAGEIGDEQVPVAIAVAIANIDSHAGLGLAAHIVGHPGLQGYIAERAIASVLVEEVGHPVVGYVQILVAVLVPVPSHHAQPLALGIGNAGGHGYIDKSTVPRVVVEHIGHPPILAGRAVRARIFANGAQARVIRVDEAAADFVSR